jgi:predicted transcriptional regulator
MRTTVDIDEALLERAKRLALKEKQTLGAVVGQALAAYLSTRRPAEKDPPFELIVAGSARGRFPTPTEIAAVEEEDDVRALALPSRK